MGYNDVKFKDALDRIYGFVHNEEEEYDFLTEFVETECSQQIAIYQKKIKQNANVRAGMKRVQTFDYGDEMDEDARYLEMQIENNQMEIHSQPTDNVNEHVVVISNQGTQSHAKYEWALFRKKKLKNVFMKNIRTSGYWKILTRDSLDDDADLFEMEEKKEKEVGGFDIFTTDLKKSGSEPYDDVVVVHRDLSDLNAILLFFHQMEIDPFFNESDEQKLDFSPSDLSQMKQPIIRIIIQHEEMSSIPDNRFVDEDGSQKNIVEFSDDGKEQSIEEERWYDIY